MPTNERTGSKNKNNDAEDKMVVQNSVVCRCLRNCCLYCHHLLSLLN